MAAKSVSSSFHIIQKEMFKLTDAGEIEHFYQAFAALRSTQKLPPVAKDDWLFSGFVRYLLARGHISRDTRFGPGWAKTVPGYTTASVTIRALLLASITIDMTPPLYVRLGDLCAFCLYERLLRVKNRTPSLREMLVNIDQLLPGIEDQLPEYILNRKLGFLLTANLPLPIGV